MIITKQKEKNWQAMENPMSIILFVPLSLSLHLLIIFFVVLSYVLLISLRQVTSSLLTEKRKCKKGIRWPLPHLKVVKLWGIYSGVLNLELVRYFLENAVALEKVIIDPTEPIFCPHPLSPEDIKELQTSRNRAKLQLEREVPQAIELVIL